MDIGCTFYMLCLDNLSSAEAKWLDLHKYIDSHACWKPTNAYNYRNNAPAFTSAIIIWISDPLQKRGWIISNITFEVAFRDFSREMMSKKVNPGGNRWVSPHWADKDELIPWWNISISLYTRWCFISSYVRRMQWQNMRRLLWPRARPCWKGW